ncbi:putative glutathione S-transferase [Silene latifolia]|uniref:putative glutathione S-transferase n=1 Tax=Silene latifolia TaxID=37657 RepID=UPI003D781656
MEGVQLIGVWGSPFSRRVEIALKMKGIKYEFIEENLRNKSELLLKSNPVHKQIPVLLHNSKPIVESLLILEYIDETWNQNPILPQDVYDKALDRFWASFFDHKVVPAMRKTRASRPGKESEKAVEELQTLLMILENEINGKKFFGGNKIGFVDIVGLFLAYWFPLILEAMGKEQVMTIDKFPGLCKWTDNLLNCSVIKENLPDKEKLVTFLRALFLVTTTT